MGRFLEHARIYAFGEEADTIYLSSADMMTRNTERRVEIAYPVTDPACRRIVRHFMELQLADNVKARQLTSEGSWGRVERAEGDPEVNCQELLLAEAYEAAREAARPARPRQEAPIEPEAAVPALASVEKSEVPDAQAAPVSHNGERAGTGLSRALALRRGDQDAIRQELERGRGNDAAGEDRADGLRPRGGGQARERQDRLRGGSRAR